MAKQLGANLLLIDEKLGRGIANEMNIQTIRVLGVMLEAKKRKLIVSVREEMDKLRKIGFWISDVLYDRVSRLEDNIEN